MKKMHILLIALTALTLLACGKTDNTSGGNSETQAPAAPTGLKLHGATETSLTFQWTAVEGASGYKWTLSKASQTVDQGQTSTRNVTVNNLEKATTYVFSVYTVAGGKTSAASSLEAKTEGTGESGGGGGEETDLSRFYSQFGIPEVEEDGKARAFPGAEGGGMWITGGRGGSVYHVTSLGDSASEQGTLRYGIEKGERPLVIVFDVAGVIELTKQLNISKGDLTIAGQTAPGDGICLKNYTFRVSADNVVVRFIRCRMGDEKKTEDDAIQVMSRDKIFDGIVIDHCSVSWCTDECASFYGMKNFSFSWNMVTESLRNSVHDKGAHGYGGIWGGENAFYSHNLLAHHDSRNPRLDHDYVSTQKGPVSVLNNVIYNWSGNSTYGGESASADGSCRVYNIINNYYKPGPATSSKKIWFLDPTTSCSNCANKGGYAVVPGHFYMTGNFMTGKSDMTADNWTGTTASSSVIAKIRADKAFSYADNPVFVSLHGAEDAYDAVVAYAGASFSRDVIDTRIAGETKAGNYTYTGSNGSKNGLIDTQGDVGGWPEYSFDANDERLKDADSDGMPNWFEEQFGLQKSNAADARQFSLDPQKRYTNLEMYLHYLVKDIVSGQTAKASYTNF